jgi:hypothetical protein
LAVQLVQRLLAVGSPRDFEAAIGKLVLEEVEDQLLIVADQGPRLRADSLIDRPSPSGSERPACRHDDPCNRAARRRRSKWLWLQTKHEPHGAQNYGSGGDRDEYEFKHCG